MFRVIFVSIVYLQIIKVLTLIVIPGNQYGKGGMTWDEAHRNSSYANLLHSAGKRSLGSEANGEPSGQRVKCKLFPEVVLVQDISASYEPDMVTLHGLMPKFLQFLSTEYSGYAKFGITSFVDKNVKGLGDVNDFCVNMESPLIRLSHPEILKTVQQSLQNMEVGGGGDWLEGANMGMLRTAITDQIGWSTEDYDTASGRVVKRVMIISTDAAMHDAPYHAQQVHANLPPNNLDLRKNEVTKNINVACSEIDYPRPEQIAAEFKARGIIPIIFAGKPYSIQHGYKVPFRQWTETIERYGQQHGPWADIETGLSSYYADFLSNVLKVPGVVHNIEMESTNFVDIVKAAMLEVNILSCPDPTDAPGNITTQLSTEFPTPSTSQSTNELPTGSTAQTSTELPTGSTTQTSNGTIPGGGDQTTEEDSTKGGASTAVVIGSAAAGAVAGIAAIAALIKFVGFGGSAASVPGTNVISQDVTNVNSTVDREQFETVSGDLFA